MKRSVTWLALACLGIVGLGVFAGRMELWSSSAKPPTPASLTPPSAQAASMDPAAESLEQAFIRVADVVGPAVVSISTEQIEQVQQYYRGHPFFGEGPLDDMFRDFFGGEGPQGQAPRKRFGLGSGVIIDEKGFILTNEHVVADADKIAVTLADGREFSGEVKGKDLRSDLAVIKINAKNLPSARLGDSDSVHTGQWAIALGNPFGLVGAGSGSMGAEPTLTVGVVSALHRRLPRPSRSDRDYSDLIQTDAAINPGNSGGPLVNLKGDIIGINVAILTSSRGSEGVGFAIPANKAKSVVGALIEGKKVLYGWLGVQIQDVTQDVAEYYGLQDREGVLVYQVVDGGPAQKAGMKDGDIVKVFDGEPIKSSQQLVNKVGGAKVGKKVAVEMLREGKRQTLTIEIGERPNEDVVEQGASAEAWRGIKVTQLTPQLAEHFGLSAEATGVVVTDVASDSPASEAGMQEGTVINEVNRMRIQTLDDYRQAIAKAQGNVLVRTNRGYVVIKIPGQRAP